MPPDVESFNPAGVVHGRQPMPDGSFLSFLSDRQWKRHFVGRGDSRVHPAGDELPVGREDGAVHIVLGGCVARERTHLRTKLVRFRGVGQLLGEANLVGSHAGGRTVCLGDTWVMSLTTARMHSVLTRQPDVQMALLRSLEARNRSDEMIYGTFGRPALARVGALLYHLATVSGKKDPLGVRIAGIRQTDLADALLVGRSTVENAFKELKALGVARSGYRQIVMTDMDGLAELVWPPRS
ncbi:hypothetical protein SSPS47_10850 [Streptomyces sp. S4.7]|nr:hypothetical protein SSPS47_10850 [Streptomyces sp. S4.7]